MRRSSSADVLAPTTERRATDSGGAAERMINNFARRERERRASFSEIQSWEGLQARLGSGSGASAGRKFDGLQSCCVWFESDLKINISHGL
jgi:hypothetical protein